MDLRAFRQLARDKSIDEATKLRGGDLRYFDNQGKVARRRRRRRCPRRS